MTKRLPSSWRTRGNAKYFAPKAGATREAMFTPSEREAILDAARTVFSVTFNDSQKLFHGEAGENGFLGEAWGRTQKDNAPISWDTILKAYADQTGEDVTALALILAWRKQRTTMAALEGSDLRGRRDAQSPCMVSQGDCHSRATHFTIKMQ